MGHIDRKARRLLAESKLAESASGRFDSPNTKASTRQIRRVIAFSRRPLKTSTRRNFYFGIFYGLFQHYSISYNFLDYKM